jgi:hypothetical protein
MMFQLGGEAQNNEIHMNEYCLIFIFRFVYEDLVTKGAIVPAQEVPPPTVPMDYSWARVGTLGVPSSMG